MKQTDTLPAWDLKNHGDMLEYIAYGFIHEKLQPYELTWATYIGHDGRGNPAPLVQANGEVLKESHPLSRQRLKFSQYHYTVLESLFSLQRLKLSPSRPYLHDTSYLSGDDYFLEVNDSIVLFHAQLGSLRDALCKSAECLKLTHDTKELDELWLPRCIVLHGPRIPIIRRDIFMQDVDAFIIEPSYESGKWEDKESSWSHFTKAKDYIPLTDYFTSKTELAIKLAVGRLYKLYSAVEDIRKTNKIRLHPPPTRSYHGERAYSGGKPEDPTIASGYIRTETE